MKIAVTSQNKRTITGHAGKTSRFLIYNVDSNKILDKTEVELEKQDLLHNRFHESSNPWAPHPIFDVDIVITAGAGQGFVNRLERMNTTVMITTETDPDQAVSLLLADKLPVKAAEHHHHHR